MTVSDPQPGNRATFCAGRHLRAICQSSLEDAWDRLTLPASGLVYLDANHIIALATS